MITNDPVLDKARKRSFMMRAIKRFSSGSKRRSSDDSTTSTASLQDVSNGSMNSMGGGGSAKPMRVPATIPEQNELTKEQLDAALRNEQIEQAATERDEKRKRRVKEALTSMTRRFEAAYNAISAEMGEAVAQSNWSQKERQAVMAIIAFLFVMTLTGIHWPSTIICLGMLTYSYRSFKERNEDARQAEDNVSARLDDVEDGIRRCALAVQHDLEADAEWEASMKEEQRMWEERQKELLVKRGRALQNLNTRRKKFVEQIRSQAAHLPDHFPDKVTQKARHLLDKTSQFMDKTTHFTHRQNRSRTHSRHADSDSASETIDTDPAASSAWIKYVQTNLPLERLETETPEEQQFAQLLRQKSEGRWDAIPHDLQLMVLRGYADKKDRMKESLEAVNYIVEWRAHCDADNLLRTADDQAKLFFEAWGSRFAGEDRYGHLIVFDRVEWFDLKTLFTLTDDEVLRMRTKQMEVLRRLKHRSSDRRGQRVCKHIYMMDLSGLSMGKHFTPRVKNLLGHIFKVGGDAYPDSLWQLWLVNTPLMFQVIWKFISPIIDSVTKSKIRMMGGKDKYIPEMEKCGMPRSCIPKELGGDAVSASFFDALLEMVEEEKHRSDLGVGGVPEDPSAIEVVPDPDSAML